MVAREEQVMRELKDKGVLVEILDGDEERSTDNKLLDLNEGFDDAESEEGEAGDDDPRHTTSDHVDMNPSPLDLYTGDSVPLLAVSSLSNPRTCMEVPHKLSNTRTGELTHRRWLLRNTVQQYTLHCRLQNTMRQTHY